jgi:small subunit ribosomal protein S16
MLRIRLRRVGKKKQPMYRIVVADSRSPRDGAFVESLGYYHPLENPSTIVLDQERAKHWLDHGAQPSDRVWKILAVQGLAEIPPKLQTRIALGEQRAKDAAAEKAKAKAEEAAAPTAEAPPPAAEAAAAPAEAAPEAAAEAAPDEAEAAPPEASAEGAAAPEEAEAPAEAEGQ